MKVHKKLPLYILLFLFCISEVINSLELYKSKSVTTFQNNNERVIYLTFDDGPSSITNNILDILKQHQVKATFFLIGCNIKGKENELRRMYTEGHSIGLHTYSHNYKQIYASEDAFIEEMIKTSKEINKVIGIQPNIIRFPYGSNPHLNSAFLKKLHANNFKIYDWNASISDGVSPNTSPEQFTKEAIARGNGINYVIFLMHCNNANLNTCKSLPQIIDHYKKLGYEFKVITSETPEFYWHQ